MPNQKNQSSVISFLLISLVLLAVVVLMPYLAPLVLAFVFAVAGGPAFREILKFVRIKWIASLLVTLLVLVVILVPLAFFGKMVLNEANQVYSSLSHQNGGGGSEIINFIKNKIDQIVPSSWGTVDTTSYAKQILSWFVGNLSSVFSSIIQGVITFIFSLLMLFYLLRDWQELRDFLISRSPLGERNTKIIFEKIHESVSSVIRGSLVVAIIDGILTGTGFALFGVPNPALWGGMAVFAALIPTLGTAVVLIPGILYLAFSGVGINAVGLTLWSVSTVGLMDNFVGPRMVGKGTKVYPLLVLLGVLGGVSVFGLVGFIIGPLIFALLFAVLDIYKAIWQDKSQAND